MSDNDGHKLTETYNDADSMIMSEHKTQHQGQDFNGKRLSVTDKRVPKPEAYNNETTTLKRHSDKFASTHRVSRQDDTIDNNSKMQPLTLLFQDPKERNVALLP